MNQQCVLIGGDNRHKHLAKILIEQGFTVYCIGMERCIHLPPQAIDTRQIPTEADLIILPIPITKDGATVFASYSASPIPLSSLLRQITSNQQVYGGLFTNEIKQMLQLNKVTFFDYGADEQFAESNAIPSAEGAIELALHNTPYTLHSASVCVVGYGRIGKALVKRLQGMGCNVTATARRESHLQAIKQTGATALHTAKLPEAKPFDIIFNTVPSMVVNQSVLEQQKDSLLLIDLASKPGGIDFDYAHRRNMRCIHALSLPAICAPYTAAQNTWHSIQQSIASKEEKQ